MFEELKFFFFLILIFSLNWRIIVLQCCVFSATKFLKQIILEKPEIVMQCYNQVCIHVSKEYLKENAVKYCIWLLPSYLGSLSQLVTLKLVIMKPRSKVCFTGQLILQQEKHFSLSSYDLDLGFFQKKHRGLSRHYFDFLRKLKK